MATVESYTKAYMDPILDATVIDAHLEPDGDLILEHQDGSESSAGNIVPALAMVYPVGSIYMSVLNTNPGTLFGGTWSAFGAGRMPIGVSADTRFDVAEETGGTDQITANMLPTHTHAIGGSSGSEGSHLHTIGGSSVAEAAHTHGPGSLSTGSETADHAHGIPNPINLQKALTANTAGGENSGNSVMAGHTAGRYMSNVTTNGGATGGRTAAHGHFVDAGASAAGSSHSHTLPANTGSPTASHLHSMPANTGNNTTTADKFLPPFIAVYMWKRTA